MSPSDYPARPARLGRGAAKRLMAPRRSDSARTFTAVFPPASVLASLTDLRSQIEPHLPGVRWIAPENLHFTLRFFGELTREERERAAQVMEAVVPLRPVFSLEIAGFGVFPNWRRPRVLWVGATLGSGSLVELARSLEHGFREARLGKADKPFVPHLTLGRWREGAPMPPPDAEERSAGLAGAGAFPVTEVGLIQSVLGPRGSTYTPLHRSVLGAGGSA